MDDLALGLDRSTAWAALLQAGDGVPSEAAVDAVAEALRTQREWIVDTMRGVADVFDKKAEALSRDYKVAETLRVAAQIVRGALDELSADD